MSWVAAAIAAVAVIASSVSGSKSQKKQLDRQLDVTNPKQLRELRAITAETAQAQPRQIAIALARANGAITQSEDAQAKAIMDQARSIGALTDERISQIEQLAQQTGLSLNDASLRVLGQDQITVITEQIRQQVPGFIEDAGNNADELVSASQQLQQETGQFIQSFPDFVTQNQDVAGQLQSISSEQREFVDRQLGVEQTGQQNINNALALQGQFDDIFGSTQELQTDAGNLTDQLLLSTEQQLNQSFDQERENLADFLESQGLADSGAAIEANNALAQQQGKRRTDALTKIQVDAQQREFQNRLGALQQGAAVTGAQGALTGQTGNLVANQANIGQLGLNALEASANTLGQASNVIGASGGLASAASQLIQNNLAFIDQQGRLIDRQTGRELQGAELEQKILSSQFNQSGQQASQLANLALAQNQLQGAALSDAGALEQANITNQFTQDTALALLPVNTAQQRLQNSSTVGGNLINQGLTGTSASIGANAALAAGTQQRLDELSDAQARGVSDLVTSIGQRNSNAPQGSTSASEVQQTDPFVAAPQSETPGAAGPGF